MSVQQLNTKTSQLAETPKIPTWDEVYPSETNLTEKFEDPDSKTNSGSEMNSSNSNSSSPLSSWDEFLKGSLYREKDQETRKNRRKARKQKKDSFQEIDEDGRVVQHYVSGELITAQERLRLRKEEKRKARKRDDYRFKGFYQLSKDGAWMHPGYNPGRDLAGEIRIWRLINLQKMEWFDGISEDPEHDPRYDPPPPGGSTYVFSITEIINTDESGKEISRSVKRSTKIYGAGGRLLNPSEDETAPGDKGVTDEHDGHVHVPRFVTKNMGQYIANLRKNSNLTQRELNIKVNAPNNTIRDIELGGIYPYRHNDPVLLAITKFFGVPQLKYY
jgi:DNA-binding XRE family transcriptional regulator